MTSPWTREKVENWAADFCAGEAARRFSGGAREYAGEVLATLLLRACEARGIEGHEVVWLAAPDPRPPDAIGEIAARALTGVPGVEACVRRGSFVDTARAERLLGWRATRTLRDARVIRSSRG